MFGSEYDKINTVFMRDDRGLIIPGEYATQEIEYLAGRPWLWAEKIDGTNVRIHWDGQRVLVGGRTDDAQIPTKLVVTLQTKLTPELMAAVFTSNDVTLYGEGCAPGIQDSHHYTQTPSIILFDVKIDEWWLYPSNVNVVAQNLGLQVAPFFGEWTIPQAAEIVSTTALLRASRFKPESPPSSFTLDSYWPGVQIEGLVGRPPVQLFTRKGERILVKLKVKDYTRYYRQNNPDKKG